MFIHENYTVAVFRSRSEYTAPDVSHTPTFQNNAEMEYGQNIKRFRKAARLTQAQLAEKMGVEQPTVQRWETQKREPSLPDLERMAGILGVTVSDFFSNVTTAQLGPRLFVKGQVAAGVFSDAWEEDPDNWQEFTGRPDHASPASERFGLRVAGDSMNEIYPHGTIIECVRYWGDYQIPNGKRVVVQRKQCGDGIETTVKEYLRDAEGIEWLVPRSTNPAFQTPFRCDQPGADIEEISIIAVVIASIRPE